MPTQDPGTEVAREVARTAARRLGHLETLLLAGAALIAAVAGGLTAWLANDALGWPVRPVWFGASTIFLVVPAVVVWVRDRRTPGAHRARSADDRD